jgi:hypothetical protein
MFDWIYPPYVIIGVIVLCVAVFAWIKFWPRIAAWLEEQGFEFSFLFEYHPGYEENLTEISPFGPPTLSVPHSIDFSSGELQNAEDLIFDFTLDSYHINEIFPHLVRLLMAVEGFITENMKGPDTVIMTEEFYRGITGEMSGGGKHISGMTHVLNMKLEFGRTGEDLHEDFRLELRNEF